MNIRQLSALGTCMCAAEGVLDENDKYLVEEMLDYNVAYDLTDEEAAEVDRIHEVVMAAEAEAEPEELFNEEGLPVNAEGELVDDDGIPLP